MIIIILAILIAVGLIVLAIAIGWAMTIIGETQ
jgi:hypothetical protein